MPRFASFPNREIFYERVWEMVRRIPTGKVATYGQIALLVGPPDDVDPQTYRAFGARWVGGAMANCPPDVPWHRVINAQGQISVRKGDAHLRQRTRLEAEGVQFDPNTGKIKLTEYGWDPDQPSGSQTPKQPALF